MTEPSSDHIHEVHEPDEPDYDTTTKALIDRHAHAETAWNADSMLRVLAFDGSLRAVALLLLAVEREVDPFDFALHVDAPEDRYSIDAELARALHIAVSAGVPALRLASGSRPGDTIKDKLREILGFPPPHAKFRTARPSSWPLRQAWTTSTWPPGAASRSSGTASRCLTWGGATASARST